MAADGGFRLDRGTPGALAVSGVLSFATAATALRDIDAALHAGAFTRLDLAGVGNCDSAGLACLLALLAAAKERGQALALLHVPAGLRTLAQVSGVDGLLDAN